jgi:hypothetical protein
MQQGAPSLRQDSSPMRTPAGVQKTGDRRSSGSPGVQGQLGSPKKVMKIFFSTGQILQSPIFPQSFLFNFLPALTSLLDIFCYVIEPK